VLLPPLAGFTFVSVIAPCIDTCPPSPLYSPPSSCHDQYHEKLNNAGLEVLEKVAASDVESFPEEARTLLGDKDTLLSAISTAHDMRVAKLDAKEDQFRTDEQVRPPRGPIGFGATAALLSS
jgi:hypothetical protein